MLADQSYELKSNGEPFIQPKYLKLGANLRFTSKTMSALFHTDVDLGIGTVAWERFLDAIEIRNRITHPKKTSDLEITDDERQKCVQVVGWFNVIVHGFIEAIEAQSERVSRATHEAGFRDGAGI